MVEAKEKNTMISRNEVVQILEYNADTGEFSWKIGGKNRRKGKSAGWTNQGYKRLRVCGKEYPAHCLAWLITYNRWPIGDLEHKDLNRSNNRISNLREATRSQNMANGSTQSNNKSGYRGVFWRKSREVWVAQIHVNKRKYWLGSFKNKEDTNKAYKDAAKKYFGEFARHLN